MSVHRRLHQMHTVRRSSERVIGADRLRRRFQLASPTRLPPVNGTVSIGGPLWPGAVQVRQGPLLERLQCEERGRRSPHPWTALLRYAGRGLGLRVHPDGASGRLRRAREACLVRHVRPRQDDCFGLRPGQERDPSGAMAAETGFRSTEAAGLSSLSGSPEKGTTVNGISVRTGTCGTSMEACDCTPERGSRWRLIQLRSARSNLNSRNFTSIDLPDGGAGLGLWMGATSCGPMTFDSLPAP